MILRHCGRIRPSRSQQSPGEGIGNGRATVLRFAQEGAKILAVDPDLVSAEETAVLAAESGGECVAVQADVTREGDAGRRDGDGSRTLGPHRHSAQQCRGQHCRRRPAELHADPRERSECQSDQPECAGKSWALVPAVLEVRIHLPPVKSPLRTCCCRAFEPSADGSAPASIDIRCRLASRYCAKSERNSRPHRLSGQLVRPARIEDADVPAELVDYAGEGLPSYLWHKIAGPGETAQEVGRKRAA